MHNLFRSIILVLVLGGVGASIYYLERERVRPMGEVSESDINLNDVYDNDLPCGEGSVFPGCGSPIAGTEKSIDQEVSVKPVPPPEQVTISKAAQYEVAKEISTPDGFINTSDITIKELIGKKVILVDFWTYSCINCQRTQPYLNAWYEKYKDQGLEIIGVHTPEFEFEKNYENVKAATAQANIQYPVVLDNDYSTWRAYKNQYWPRKYLIDIDGYIVYDHIGEGFYDETEREIQKALKERMERLSVSGTVAAGTVSPTGVVTVDASKPRSPETYFGAWRNTNFGNGTSGKVYTQTFTLPKSIVRDVFYLGGDWQIEQQHIKSTQINNELAFRYRGKNVYIVARAGSEVSVEVFVDGAPIGNRSGKDVKDGVLKIQGDRLYEIVNDPNGYGEHTLELRVKTPGLEAFTFTFG